MNIIDLQERLFSDNLWTKRGGGVWFSPVHAQNL